MLRPSGMEFHLKKNAFMKLLYRILLTAMAAVSPFCVTAAPAGAWVKLDAAMCKPIDAAVALPEGWSKYRSASRQCPLTRRPNEHAQVSLISVFVDDYYFQLPKDAPWESFPPAMLVDASGQCLARLSHLFPSEPPSQLVVRAGGWKNGFPTLLRLDVLNPAVGGDYSLPSLQWDSKTKRYQPDSKAIIKTTNENLCPQI